MSEFAKLRQFLQDKEQQLIQQLKEEAAGILGKMTKNLENIEEMKKAIQKDKSNIESTLQQEDSVLLLKGITDEIKSIMKRLEEEEKQNKMRKGVFNAELVSGSLNLGVYSGPLQYSIWKEMLSVINPGLSHLTLDPNTADHGFTLSENLTSVKSSVSKYMLFNFILPFSSFDNVRCVLASEGFTSGRYYWEVEWESWKGCQLGVTKESSNRKRTATVRPKDGYWVICLYKERCYPRDMSNLWLRLGVKPQKTGVYLDYEGGQVSFYNADNMSHIYTFTDTFTERLYPCFFPYIFSEPLKLFHLKL
ncbi:zinc-binding protein A33-like [Protopterus annectens]|uniref:zinc-binding protein A33-like n=1 Tax=Protopterus annectens TaxID=7888 RepID=UPI001CFC1E4E|nr:zinc-binding protein A33-like [Protopterus annectens]